MIIRNCAGGVVFKDDKVLILKKTRKKRMGITKRENKR